MSLYHVYRPNKFSEIIGNQGIINSLDSILGRDEDIPHAFLLQGPSGCGKTTIGRIIASKLGCPETINGEVNGDFVEVNASNNRGIDTARVIMNTMHYHPSVAKCRIWLIDECHSTTKDFQNSILKALEDSPKHTYFILCTTEPDKLLKTIRNRCSTFEVKSLSDDEILTLLNNVLIEENFKIPEEAKTEIVRLSDGCPRQALVLLDQVIDLPAEEMADALINTQIDEKEVKALCQALLKRKNWKTISTIIKGLKSSEPEKIRQAIIGYMKAVMLNDISGGDSASTAALIFDCFKEPVFYTGMAGIVFAAFNTLD